MLKHTLALTMFVTLVSALGGCEADDGGVPRASLPVGFMVVNSRTETITSDNQPLLRTVTRIQNGTDPLNQFEVVRVRRGLPHLRGAVVLAPGVSLSSGSYEIGDEPGDEKTSTAGILAMANLDVYLYNPRPALLTAHQCDAPGSCAAMKEWGLDARVSDIAYIRGMIAQVYGARRPVIGGHSLGGDVALAAVNRDPSAWAGLVTVDGPLVTNDASPSDPNSTQFQYHALCAGLKSMLDNGVFMDPTGLAVTLRALYAASANDPQGSSMFFPQLTNHQALLFVLTARSPGPSLGPPVSLNTKGFQFMAGTMDGLTYGSEAFFGGIIASTTEYTPLREHLDWVCEVGGAGAFSSQLGQFRGPAIGFGMGHGALEEVAASLSKLGGPTELLTFPDYGHADILWGRNHAIDFEGRLLDWIDRNEAALGW
jgi:pimeloyl-ACP methyl ester carboxylesterase